MASPRWILALMCCATTRLTNAEHSARTGFLRVSKREVTLQEITNSVRLALSNQLLSSNSTSNTHSAVHSIEASLSATYRALPKTPQGGISSSALVYLVRSYFSKTHGWHIHGLGTHMCNVSMSEIHNASILEEMAPAIVQNLIDAQSKDHVFFLKDAVAMIATLEYLVISESARTLDDVYEMEGVEEHATANASLVLRLLVRYAVAFELPTETHRIDGMVKKIFNQGKMKDFFVVPTQDIIRNFEYMRGHESPFKKDFSFDDTLTMVTEFQKSYGRRQMEECTLMKEELAMRDDAGMGRVPLHRFYAEENAISDIFKFGESKEYLREIGALDESDPSRPKVIIPNYVQGPWNCLARSGYYAICCVNECEGLINSIEEFFGTPTVAPEALLEMVGNMSSASVEGPRKLSNPLQRKLHEIAKLHNGEVPTYGRLFAQWIHFAFPYECPYPSIHSSSIKKDLYMPGRKIGTATSAEKKEAEEQASLFANATLEEDADDQYDVLWDDMEILHLTETRKLPAARAGMRIVVLLAAIASVCVSLAGIVKKMHQMNCPTKAEGGKSDRLMV